MSESDSDFPLDFDHLDEALWRENLDVSSWLPGSLWEHSLDERSTKRFFALIAMDAFLDGTKTEITFLQDIQTLLTDPEDKELLATLIQKARNPKKRAANRPPEPFALKIYAQDIAAALLNERPNELKKNVVKRVAELLAFQGSTVLLHSRTIERWVSPLFQRLKSNALWRK